MSTKGRRESGRGGGTTMSSYERIQAVVRRVPRGRVVTYGQVAAEAGLPRAARQVGYAMAALPDDSDVPWHRVVNARGEISRRSRARGPRRAAATVAEAIQRSLLEAEGVAFDARGRIDLERYRWEPVG